MMPYGTPPSGGNFDLELGERQSSAGNGLRGITEFGEIRVLTGNHAEGLAKTFGHLLGAVSESPGRRGFGPSIVIMLLVFQEFRRFLALSAAASCDSGASGRQFPGLWRRNYRF